MKIRNVVLLVSCMWGSTVAAEEPSILVEGGTRALIFDITKVALEVSDQVEDGCMPRPNSVRDSAEAALRRNNFSVVDKESDLFFDATAVVTAIGNANGDSFCVVALTFSIFRYIRAMVPHSDDLDTSMRVTLAPFELEIRSTVLSGPKWDMQDRLERVAEKGANELFLGVERSKDYIKSNWPSLWDAAYGSESE